MSTQEQIESIVNQYLELLPVEDKNLLVKSEDKASRFLIAIAKLAAIRDQLLNAKIKKDSLLCIEFNNALQNEDIRALRDSKARESAAEAFPAYLSIREEVETIEAQLSYSKVMMDIFLNGHLVYRALMKDSLNGNV